MGRVAEAVTKKDDRLKKNLQELSGELVQELIWAEARPAALEVLRRTSELIRDRKSTWAGVVGRLDRLSDYCATEAAKRETRAGSGTRNRYVLEQDVTPAGFEQDYYTEHAEKSEKVLEHI